MNPPQLPLRFFRWYCHPKLRDSIEGDLMELYEQRVREKGKRKADLQFTLDVLLLFRRGIIKPTEGHKQLNTYGMYKSYFKIAVRHLIKHKGFSLINISGLAIGLACSMFILLWVQDELSFDQFHYDGKQMFRVNLLLPENDLKAAVTCVPLAETIKQELPEVQEVIRLSTYNGDLFQVDEKIFEENRIYYADSNFFSFFTFPLLEGDAATALDRPENIILTEQMAVKYFGTAKAVGKAIRKGSKNEEFVVSGVLKNVPSNSHLQFDFVEPMSAIAKNHQDFIRNRWDNFGWYTYVKFTHAPTPEQAKGINDQINKLYARNEKTMKAHFFIEPISAIHFTPGLLIDVPGITDRQYVYIFSIVGLFILIVACINFMNLSTARSARRAKEVGLRKVAGAFRGQLIRQFLSETFVIAMVALMWSFIIVLALIPYFDDLTGKFLSNSLFNPELLLDFFSITIITGLLAGAYPALLLSGFVPAKVLKGELADTSKSGALRNVLVVTQFSISIMLLVGTSVIFQQLKFISHRNLGYDKENLLCMPIKGDLGKDMQTLKSLLGRDPVTSNFSVVSQLPTNLENGTIAVDWDGKDKNSQPLFPNMAVDENFIDVFKMTLLSGRSFSRDIKSDSSNYMVNEEVLKMMNLTAENAIGKRLSLFGVNGIIVGVVKNFNFKSVQSPIEPMILAFNAGYGSIVVRTQPAQLESTIETLQRICKTLNPQYPFAFSFVNDDFARIYQSEHQLGKLFSIFTALGLVISCLGLYGLSAFLTERRTKEIGVRRVLGASVLGITWLLSKTFTRPIILSMAIASPLAWYAMNKWLESFAYHIEINWKIFAAAFGTALLVALISVSYETIKASFTNPSRSLRNE